MRTTGMNHIINPREQSLSESALLEGWFFFFLILFIFRDFHFLKRCSVYAIATNGNKANYPWKEVGSICSAVQWGPQCVHCEERRRPAQGADGSYVATEPCPSDVSRVWGQEVTCGVIFSCKGRQMLPDPYRGPVSKGSRDLTRRL